MKLKSYFAVIAIAIFANSCAPGFYYRPDPATTPQANTFLSNGVTFAVSNKGSTSVALTAIKPENGQLELSIVYINNDFDRVDAMPDDIKVTAMEDSVFRQYKVYNADQYLVKLQRRQNFALAMQAGSASYYNNQAGYTTTTTNNNYVSRNGAYITGTTTTTTYDASKVAALNATSQQQLQQTANNFYNYNQTLSQQLIRSNTLLKGQSIAGYVMVNTSRSFSETIYVDIPFGGEEHMFVLIPNK